MKDEKQQKSKTVSVLTGVLILAIGVILIIGNKMISSEGIVCLAGILFLLTGIINIIIYVTKKTPEGQRVNKGRSLFFGWFVSIASIILGLSMFIFTSQFTKMIPFIFGMLIFFGALMLVFTFLFSVRRIFKVPGWVWAFPIVMTILGFITLYQDPSKDPLIMILTGVSFLLFGIGEMIIGVLTSSARKKARLEEQARLASSEDPSNVMDVVAKE